MIGMEMRYEYFPDVLVRTSGLFHRLERARAAIEKNRLTMRLDEQGCRLSAMGRNYGARPQYLDTYGHYSIRSAGSVSEDRNISRDFFSLSPNSRQALPLFTAISRNPQLLIRAMSIPSSPCA
jgi:hypothetical protein